MEQTLPIPQSRTLAESRRLLLCCTTQRVLFVIPQGHSQGVTGLGQGGSTTLNELGPEKGLEGTAIEARTGVRSFSTATSGQCCTNLLFWGAE